VAADIIQRNGFIDRPVMVINRAGGGGAVGDAYTFGQRGNPAVITTYVSGQISSPLITGSPVTFRHLTPIANLAMDDFYIGVNKAAGFETIEDFIAAARENPGAITIGGSGRGTEDELVTGLLGSHAGVEFQYVAFNSTGEIMAAMLGGHVVAGIYKTPTGIIAEETGQIDLLATFRTERIEMFPHVPTFVELGYPEVVFGMFRSIFGPPGISQEAVNFWADVFEKVSQTEQWQVEFIERNGLSSHFMRGDEFTAFLEAEALKYEQILRSIGLIE
jgi:putative tricarboxylic transport membrane protein